MKNEKQMTEEEDSIKTYSTKESITKEEFQIFITKDNDVDFPTNMLISKDKAMESLSFLESSEMEEVEEDDFEDSKLSSAFNSSLFTRREQKSGNVLLYY